MSQSGKQPKAEPPMFSSPSTNDTYVINTKMMKCCINLAQIWRPVVWHHNKLTTELPASKNQLYQGLNAELFII